MTNEPNNFNPAPTLTQQRAFAYAAKPFALLSFLSSSCIIYHLLIRCSIKSKSMYHRLILSASLCLNILSFCLFWGTWAIPAGTEWIVGATGNHSTCTAQGFLYDWMYAAFPFYYASFSVLALVSIKQNFREERYAWMEKWIHAGAFVPPFIFVVYAAAKDLIQPGFAFCSYRYHILVNTNSKKLWHEILACIHFAELLVATITITYLCFNFSRIQSSVDAAIGMQKLRERARKQRTRDVTIQSGLYLCSFWFMYIANIAAFITYYLSDRIPYNALIVANVITGSQGIILLGVYYGVKQSGCAEKFTPRVSATSHCRFHETVSMIRANAANQAQRPRLSLLKPESFRIFDGTPAEDSPWAAFIDGDIESSDNDDLDTQTSETPHAFAAEKDLSSALLSYK